MSAYLIKGDNMKKITAISLSFFLASIICSCSDNAEKIDNTASTILTTAELTTIVTTTESATEKETAPQLEVGYEGMKPLTSDSVKEGVYDINVDSSSSMFKITSCNLKVSDSKMTAEMTMSGTGYEYLYMGTAEDAEKADEGNYIPAVLSGEVVSFTVPVEALDEEIDCAAFSKRKKTWYDRKLVFRADSLPIDAFSEGTLTSIDSLSLEDGKYNVKVELDGGSGKASVQSPAKLTVKDGKAIAEIIWSSNKYDYMIVEGEKILPVSTEEFSVFEIPVSTFDYRMPVSANTTAMSTPHEIEYTLFFDSASISK